MDRRRRSALIAIAAICLVAGGAYVFVAALDSGQVTSDAQPRVAAGASALGGAELMVRAVDERDTRLNGGVFVLDRGAPRLPGGEELPCQRVYFAAGRGLCLAVAPSGVDFEATIFDRSLRPLHRLGLTGVPSRARVSPDGRYGAMTVFVTGHAYLGGGGFSTTTTIVDMRSGEPIVELEQFDVSKDGQSFDAVDFNFWGVTFARDSNRFYATLHSGESYYLVEGDVRARTMTVLRDGVECPSLSPDGTRIAYKSRIGDSDRWHLRVLDLATLADAGVAERRSVDDQAEWLDDGTVAYAVGGNVYSIPADGSGKPRLLVRDAVSPVRLGAERRQVSERFAR
jgi:hypothetical protein